MKGPLFLPLLFSLSFFLSCASGGHQLDFSFPVETDYPYIDKTYNSFIASILEADQEKFFTMYGNQELVRLDQDLTKDFFNEMKCEIGSFLETSSLKLEVEAKRKKNGQALLYKYKVYKNENSKQLVVSLLRVDKSKHIRVIHIGFESYSEIR